MSAERAVSSTPIIHTLRALAIIVLFGLSGATALLYQVAFGKKLSTIFGATAYAVSAVLAAFMAGLAIGAFFGGKWGGRVKRPLVVYGACEIVVGAVCAVTPLLFDGVTDIYVGLARAVPASLTAVTLVRWLLASAVVVVPTIAMGATLPMLAREVVGAAEVPARGKHRLSSLYAVNTLGGALGAVASAYFVLPSLGVAQTMRAAAVVNVAIGITAWWLARYGSARTGEQEEFAGRVSAEDEPNMAVLGGLAATSGVLVFTTEVVDTHLLALLIGNSAYAFGLMLAVFLLCLGLGAIVAHPLERLLGAAAITYGLVATAISLVITLPLWEQLPGVFRWVGLSVVSFEGREGVRALAAAMVLVAPTISMGLTFPLLLRRVATSKALSRKVGQLTAVNTVGSIVGAIACGYFVLPRLGSEWTLRLSALAFGGAAALSLRIAPQARRLTFAGIAVIAMGVLALPRWDMTVMTNGANVYFRARHPPEALLYVAEDVHGGFTTVERRSGGTTLLTNGKFQGNDHSEVTAQQSFAHFPCLFVTNYGAALVIGLGTGTTLGTVAAYPFERIEVAEISPAIVHAARTFFAGANRGALDDERVSLTINDGRNLLLVDERRYDLIAMELSSIWFAGAANLYSADFYQLVRSRLTPGGRFQQWMQLHHIRREELSVALRSVRAAFEHVAIFVSGGQGIVVASASPLVVSRAHLAKLSERPAIRETLGGLQSLEALVDRVMLSGPELDRYISDSGGDLISTDENLYLEYATPKGNVFAHSWSFRKSVSDLESYRAADQKDRHLMP